ncbi:MAG: flagellar basal body L-ring protein FlgH [Candidatus Latescibacterota bacterium]|nr:flagellar basal body L-ring protein FlgH [Candidatus Latescibacterota bacterium]
MKTLTLVVLVVFTVTPLLAQGLFGNRPSNSSSSMFQDRRASRAREIGDILTVLVMESTTASNSSLMDTNKENKLAVTMPGGLKLPGFGITSDAKNEFKGEGTTSRSQSIQARVSVRVVDVMPNGDLVIEGSRVIDVNGESEVVYVNGLVNPFVIPATNMIESFRIANLQVSYKGKGALTEGSRPGFVVRFVNWLF